MHPTATFFERLFGAFLVTFLLSRLFLWLTRKWDGGIHRIAMAHGTSLTICWVGYAFGSADRGPLNWSGGFIYALPQLVWFGVDLARGSGDVDPAVDKGLEKTFD